MKITSLLPNALVLVSYVQLKTSFAVEETTLIRRTQHPHEGELELIFKSVHNLRLRPQHTPQKDGLMVLAFFFEKIVSGCQIVNNIIDTNLHKNEGNVLYNRQNISMFDAICTYYHIVNPILNAKNGVWSNIE